MCIYEFQILVVGEGRGEGGLNLAFTAIGLPLTFSSMMNAMKEILLETSVVVTAFIVGKSLFHALNSLFIQT